MERAVKEYIQQLISEHAILSSPGKISFASVGGGSINDTWQVTAGNNTFFCKINAAAAYPGLFEKEAAGLKTLAATACILTPGITGIYNWNNYQVLLMEWIEGGLRAQTFWKKFGEQLARLHSWKDPSLPRPFFGWNE